MTNPNAHSSLASWLTRQGSVPPAGVVRAARLGGYAYATLPASDPARAQFRADYLAALTRHHAIRQELLPLLAAWHAAGIEVLFFKGFYMAEFVYPVPGGRFHGDVDLAIRGGEAAAARLARDRGWDEDANSVAAGRPYLHYAFNLSRRDGATRIDIHRYLLHSRLPGARTQRRVTAAVWERARRHELDGVPCWLPDPTDALLLLALQRCWGDRWRLKAHDAPDMRYLGERFGVRNAQVLARARELQCERTVGIFLRMCDPQAGHVRLAAPERRIVRGWQRTVVRERPLLAIERQLVYPLLAPGILRDVLHVLPLVLRTIRLVRTHRDIHALLGAATPRTVAPASGTDEQRRRLVRGVRWCIRLLRVKAGGPCLVRSLAIYTALRARGWPAVFVSGIRRDDAGRAVGHAWVELDDRVLPELHEPENRNNFAINVRYPGDIARVA